MCGVLPPFSAEGTEVWNYNSIWSGGKNVVSVPEVRRFGVTPPFMPRSTTYVNILPFKVEMKILWNYAYI